MNLLVIRMSAMGDVALTLPAIRSVLDQYPDLHMTVVTREQFVPFFEHVQRLSWVVAEVKGKHQGIPGLYRLYREIKLTHQTDAVIDLHHVLRSRVLSLFFKMAGVPVHNIHKGRREKRQLTAKTNKQLRPLIHTVIRYLNVFAEAGFPANLSPQTAWYGHTVFPESFLQQHHWLPKSVPWIGIAPFAKHREKRWPLEKMESVISSFGERECRIALFGGGPHEIAALKQIHDKHPHTLVVAGELSLPEELGLMRSLDLMVSMDSANMHLAALSGIPVISIWGATHPFVGFGPINGNEQNMVQIPVTQLGCRPCSVFGNIPCYRKDHACMEWLEPEKVIEKVRTLLAS